MDFPRLVAHWQGLAAEVEAGTRVIVLQFADEAESELTGTVSLSMPFSETGPFQGGWEELVVSRGCEAGDVQIGRGGEGKGKDSVGLCLSF